MLSLSSDKKFEYLTLSLSNNENFEYFTKNLLNDENHENYFVNLGPNIDCCVPEVSTPAGHKHLLQGELLVNVVHSHSKVGICRISLQ